MAITSVLANGCASFSHRLSVVYGIYSQCTLYAPVHKSKRSFTLKLSLLYAIMFFLSLSLHCLLLLLLLGPTTKKLNQFICYLLLYEMCAETASLWPTVSHSNTSAPKSGITALSYLMTMMILMIYVASFFHRFSSRTRWNLAMVCPHRNFSFRCVLF